MRDGNSEGDLLVKVITIKEVFSNSWKIVIH